MDDAVDLNTIPGDPPAAPPEPVAPPREAYLAALRLYEPSRLYEMHATLGLHEPSPRSGSLAAAIADRLAESRTAERAIAGLSLGPRLALSLFALTEAPSWPLPGLAHALSCLGVAPAPAIQTLLERGLLAVRLGDGSSVTSIARIVADDSPARATLFAHPAALANARTVLPEGDRPPVAGPVRHEREADGLEPVLRLAAIWQRVEEAPIRQTQQGTLYKRDRDRLEDEAVLAGPITDAFEPLPDMAAFWLALARSVGLIVAEPGTDRIVAARPEFWAENAYHLTQMIATRWLALRSWHEQGGMRQEGNPIELALPYVRPAVLLWLATLDPADWVALDDLAIHLSAIAPHWNSLAFLGAPPETPPGRSKPSARTGQSALNSPERNTIGAILLGAAYQLGLVRAAEEVATGRRVVQLSALGRYILALGPPPPMRPVFEHFLFVQPNFEIIAYRQGLTPALIGEFSRFTRWSQVGAALELKLTPESVYRGLEGGMTPEAILERLARHSPRPLPAGVAEAVRTWADRRERVTYYASATLVEFASRADLDQALKAWPAEASSAPVIVSDRLLLVEDEASIPYQRFRLTGARDYRRPPEVCIEVEADGVTLSLDLGRSDLLVDAELARFTDPISREPTSPHGNPRRRFLVSARSLARAAENGLTSSVLAHWYEKRTGGGVPPAVGLLMRAMSGRVPHLTTSRPLILHAHSSDLLDGLLQHPDTRPFLGERLGPTTAIITEETAAAFQRALDRLGLTLDC